MARFARVGALRKRLRSTAPVVITPPPLTEMHIGDLPGGWKQVSAVDFSTIPDFPIGTLTSQDSANSRLTSTDPASLALRDKVRFYQAGHPDTSQVGVYDPARFSLVNGILTLNMAVIGGVPTGGHLHPVVAGQESTSGAWRLPTPGIRYRVMARFNGNDPHWGGVTFSISAVKAEDDWSEGSSQSANIEGFFHNAVSGQDPVGPVPAMSRHDWHLYDAARIPSSAAAPSVTYLVDDYQAYRTTDPAKIGNDTMSLHFQACTDGAAPAAGTTGTIEIAFIEQYQYVPSDLPTAARTGWTQTVAEDYTTPAAAGQFRSVYPAQTTYDNFRDAAGSWYETDAITVHDGAADMELRYDPLTARFRSAAILPNQLTAQLYGSFEFKVWVDRVIGAVGPLRAVFLLYPAAYSGHPNGNGQLGQIDLYEGDLNAHVVEFHSRSVIGAGTQLGQVTAVSMLEPHRIRLDWTPTRVEFFVDGVSSYAITDSRFIPSNPMVLRLQAESQAVPDQGASAHVNVDWVAMYRYTPVLTGTAPAAPTGVTAVAGDKSAVVSFTPVSGAAYHTVTASPGGVRATSTAGSPITVYGLDNNVGYTFTVQAANTAGLGAASVASEKVVPEPPFTLNVTEPTAATTGLLDRSVTLTAVTTDLNVTVDGTVLENMDFQCFVNVKAANVTIRNCRVSGYPTQGTAREMIFATDARCINLRVERCEFRPQFPWAGQGSIMGHDYTEVRCDTSYTCDSGASYKPTTIGASANVLVQGAYRHDLWYATGAITGQSDNHTHNDSHQHSGGYDLTIEGSALHGYWAADEDIPPGVFDSTGKVISGNCNDKLGYGLDNRHINAVLQVGQGGGTIADRITVRKCWTYGSLTVFNLVGAAPTASQIVLDSNIIEPPLYGRNNVVRCATAAQVVTCTNNKYTDGSPMAGTVGAGRYNEK